MLIMGLLLLLKNENEVNLLNENVAENQVNETETENYVEGENGAATVNEVESDNWAAAVNKVEGNNGACFYSDTCEWKLFASLVKSEDSFQIKSLKNVHKLVH